MSEVEMSSIRDLDGNAALLHGDSAQVLLERSDEQLDVAIVTAVEAAQQTAENCITVPLLLTHLRFGLFQLVLLLCVGCAFMADAFEMFLLSFLLPVFRQQWHLSPWTEAAVASVSFFGFMVGSSVWGALADKIGRRRTYIGVLLALLGFGLLQLLTFNVALLFVLRFIMGIAVGGVFVGYALFSEMLPARSRSFWLNVLQCFFALGSVFGGLVAYAVLERYSWRAVVAVGTLPTVVALACVPFVPESVRFLAVHGQKEELRKTFIRISKMNRVALPSGEPVLRLIVVVEDEADEAVFARLRRIFEKGLRRLTIVMSLEWFIVGFTYYGIVFMLPGLFESLQLSPTLFTFITGAAEALFLLSCGVVANWIGRKKAISLYFATSCLATALLSLGANVHPVVLLLFSLVARGAISAAFAVLVMATVELYATNIRGTAVGFCNSASRISGILTPFVALPLMQYSVILPLSIYGAFALAGAVLTFVFVKEPNMDAIQ